MHAHEVRDRAHYAMIDGVVPKLRTDLPTTVATMAGDATTATVAIENDKIWGLVPTKYYKYLLLFK